MSNYIIDRYETISNELVNACADPSFGEDQLEPLYSNFLEFLAENADKKAELVELIINTIKKYRTARTEGGRLFPGMALAYAMHELRWVEILEFAESENRQYYASKMEAVMTSLIDAYTDAWEDKLFFKRFE